MDFKGSAFDGVKGQSPLPSFIDPPMLPIVMTSLYRRLGLLLALLAFVSLLALGATVLPDDASAAQQTELDAVSILCASSPAASPAHRPHPPRHHASPALCPLSLALALPLIVLALLPLLLGPAAQLVAWCRRDAADSLPSSLASCLGLPRGPPILA